MKRFFIIGILYLLAGCNPQRKSDNQTSGVYIDTISPSITYAPDSNAISILFNDVKIEGVENKSATYYFELHLPVRTSIDTQTINQLRINIQKPTSKSASMEIALDNELNFFEFEKDIEIRQDTLLEFRQLLKSKSKVSCVIKLNGELDLLVVDSWDIGKLK